MKKVKIIIGIIFLVLLVSVLSSDSEAASCSSCDSKTWVWSGSSCPWSYGGNSYCGYSGPYWSSYYRRYWYRCKYTVPANDGQRCYTGCWSGNVYYYKCSDGSCSAWDGWGGCCDDGTRNCDADDPPCGQTRDGRWKDNCGNDHGPCTKDGGCCRVEGTLSDWSCGGCSKTCGGGTKACTRTCDGASCGGNCNGASLSENQPCNTQSCCTPTTETCNGADQDCDGNIDEGAHCYDLNGDGCINNADYDIFIPHYGGSASGANGVYDFDGNGAINYDDFILLAQNYNLQNGGWSAWSCPNWDTIACSKPCGPGTKTRTCTRSCNNPAPSCGGSDCGTDNSKTETQNCNIGCSAGKSCSGGICLNNDYQSCSDGWVCLSGHCAFYPNGNGICYPSTGTPCVTNSGPINPGTQLCDGDSRKRCDYDSVTKTSKWTTVTNTCNDGDECTKNDKCSGGSCVGTLNDGNLDLRNPAVDYQDFKLFGKCYGTNCGGSLPSGCTVQTCHGSDWDGDNEVHFNDFMCFSQRYGDVVQCNRAAEAGCSDSNNDGSVGHTDFLAFAGCFGDTISNPSCFRFDYNLDQDIDYYDYYCYAEDHGKTVDCSCRKNVGCSDYDKNNKVDFPDLIKFGKCFGKNVADDSSCFIFDYNLDSAIGRNDFYCFADEWGQSVDCSCGTSANCRSDANGDGEVNFQDFEEFAKCFGRTSSYCRQHFDYNNNNAINYQDFYCFIDDWGRTDCCIPTGSSRTCSSDGNCCDGAYCSKNDPDGTERPSSQWHCCRKGDQYWDPYEGASGSCVGTFGECGPVCSYDPTANPTQYFNLSNNCVIPSSQPYRQSCCSVDIYGQTDKRYMDINVY